MPNNAGSGTPHAEGRIAFGNGEAILFDQRIFHMGKMQQDASFHRDRVSLQISLDSDDFLTREWSLADNVRRKGMLHEVTQVSATTMP